MRFARLIPALALPMLLIACDQADPLAPDAPLFDAQAASAKSSWPISNAFWDVNPCTGEWHFIELTGMAWGHLHNNNWVVRTETTSTTSDGFEGFGRSTELANFGGGNVYKVSANNVLTHPSGAKFRARFVLVIDYKTEPATTRVDKGGSTCVRH
jgi:hypothetical protein